VPLRSRVPSHKTRTSRIKRLAILVAANALVAAHAADRVTIIAVAVTLVVRMLEAAGALDNVGLVKVFAAACAFRKLRRLCA
jgi:hypothetical protein